MGEGGNARMVCRGLCSLCMQVGTEWSRWVNVGDEGASTRFAQHNYRTALPAMLKRTLYMDPGTPLTAVSGYQT